MVMLDPASDESVGDVYELVAALAHWAASRGTTRLLLTSPTVVVRHAAREYGGVGRLRDPIELDLERPVRMPHRGGTVAERAALLIRALTEFDITVAPVRQPGPIGRVSSRLTGGVGDTVRMKIDTGTGRTFTLRVPDRTDLMPEGVARIADTAVSVVRRFPVEGGSIRHIAVDRSEWGLSKGRNSGVAELQQATIHLSMGHVLAYSSMELHRQRATETEKAAQRRIEKHRVSGGTQLPFVAVDATTAHETWHLIEAVFEAKRFTQSVEFRRRIGHHLGVETLEQAVKGHERNAPDSWKAACGRLMDEVSPYATTNAREATAELFKAWWCRTGDVTPVVAEFGALLDEYFVPPP